MHFPKLIRRSYSIFLIVISFMWGSVSQVHAVNTWYVWTNSPSDGPGNEWSNAFHAIQAAIDAANDNDIVLVTNGIYATGGRVACGAITNRIAITRSVTVRSVNGPVVTVIEGKGPRAQSVVRCVYVGTNALLDGFTLTNGNTRTTGEWNKDQSGGGAWCEESAVVRNCNLLGNLAYMCGGGAYGGTLENCSVVGNTVTNQGGGAYGSIMTNCTIANNTAYVGGGIFGGTLNKCMLFGNVVTNNGGGAYDSILNSCVLISNIAKYYGGGSYSGILNNCAFTNNLAYYGGGVWGGTLTNCTLTSNSAYWGGGVCSGLLYNCTLSGNFADRGGGTYLGTLF